MITIIFEAHSTTTDNEAKLASGWNDVALSALGVSQAKELGIRRAGEHFDIIFCSDLQRSFKTAELAFGNAFPVVKDERLRECDYGTLTQAPKSQIDVYREQALTGPFPGGESYLDTSARMKAFLADLLANHNGQTVMIIGHRATQYGLERWIAGKNLRSAVLDPWQYQPGWKYELTTIAE